LLLPIAMAGNTETNYFWELGTNNPITGVNMLIFTCTDNDEQCVTVEIPAWQDANSGANNYIADVEYPGGLTTLECAGRV